MLALHINTPENKEILSSTNTSLQWGFLPKHPVKFRKQSITALYPQHFCFHFHSASIELSGEACWIHSAQQGHTDPFCRTYRVVPLIGRSKTSVPVLEFISPLSSTYSCRLCWETKAWMSKYSEKGNAIFPGRSLAAQAPLEMIKDGVVSLVLHLCHFQVCSKFPPADDPV